MFVESVFLDDIIVMKKEPFIDNRGYFERIFDAEKLEGFGIKFQLVQQNISNNVKRGTLRGLHYQTGIYAEDKIIQCIKGRVFDVLVNIDVNSEDYGKWISVELSEDNRRMIYVPCKYAHGFQTLEDNTIMMYHMGNYYNAEAADGYNCFSETLGIKWPIDIGYIISEKDSKLKDFG
ncbi:MAG: dTDP-4-dehydrorhamnose 3,5-epimerase [Lachnospiraceae bacterium]|nr:dTDP-4-dehydrorhamnose 3,5-epimerase [Lachnospiraceae bacterium]